MYDKPKLLTSATRNGLSPRIREELMKRFRSLEITECPFANLPEPKGGRWGAHGGKEGGMPVAQADAGGAVRVHGVDVEARDIEVYCTGLLTTTPSRILNR